MCFQSDAKTWILQGETTVTAATGRVLVHLGAQGGAILRRRHFLHGSAFLLLHWIIPLEGLWMMVIGRPLVVMLPVTLGLLDHRRQGMKEDSWTLSCGMTGDFQRMTLGTDSSTIGLWCPTGTIEIVGGITSSMRGEDTGGGQCPHLQLQRSLLMLGLPISENGAVLQFEFHVRCTWTGDEITDVVVDVMVFSWTITSSGDSCLLLYCKKSFGFGSRSVYFALQLWKVFGVFHKSFHWIIFCEIEYYPSSVWA